MSTLALRLFGPFQAAISGNEVSGFRSDKDRALLAYLAVENARPHAREALAEILWPGYPHATALAYLRRSLSSLQNTLSTSPPGASDAAPHLLLITRDTVRLNPAAETWCDAAAFRDLLAGPPTRQALEAAVALYRGPFLEGFAINSTDFDEWLLFERERFSRQAVGALHALTVLHLEQGRPTDAAECARRQLAIDSLDEVAHCQLMAALAQDGRRSAALLQYQACRRILHDELGAEPTRQTTELYERIRSGAAPLPARPAEGAASAARIDPGLASCFVAREAELRALDRHLERALRGVGGVLFVTGDAGSGKTWLLREFGRSAMLAHPDLVAAGGRCSAFGGHGDPYLPFREILQLLTGEIEPWRAGGSITDAHARRLWEATPVALQALAETAPGLVSRLVPAEGIALRVEALAVRAGGAEAWMKQLAARAPPLAAPAAALPTPAQLEQGDLYEQVTAFLTAVARRRPLILLLDDLQWADSGTISLLFHLGKRLAASPILIVGAYRTEEAASRSFGAPDALAAVVRELQRDMAAPAIDLNLSDGRAFVDALVDSTPNWLDADFRETLFRHTEGQALFTVELLRGLQERDGLIQDEAGRWVVGAAPAWEALPPRIEAVIAERLAHLPPEWLALLEAASVEGEVFSAEVLARTAGLDEREVLRVLGDPLRRQHKLVVADSRLRLNPHGQTLSRYRFTHALYQKYLYSHLDAVDRPRLHEQTLRALQSLYGPAADEAAVQLAWHTEQAGLVEQSIRYRVQAGQRAGSLAALDEAVMHYMRALSLLATLPASSQRAEQELALHMALASSLILEQGWGSPAATNAAQRAVEISKTVDGGAQMVETLLTLADLHVGRGLIEQAVLLGEELLRLGYASRDPRAQIAGQFMLGEGFFARGSLGEARQHFETALSLLDAQPENISLLGVDLKVLCLTWLAWVLNPLGFADRSHRATDDAIKRAREIGDPRTLGFALGVAGAMLSALNGEIAQATRHAHALHILVDDSKLTVYQTIVGIVRGLERVEQGEFDAGLAQMRQGLAAWEAGGTAAGHAAFVLMLARALRTAGQIRQALELLNGALAAVAAGQIHFAEAELWHTKGMLLLEAGPDRAEAEDCIERAITLAHDRQARTLELHATMSRCRLWQAAGRHELAYAALAPLYAWFTEGFETAVLQEARALLDELAAEVERAGMLERLAPGRA